MNRHTFLLDGDNVRHGLNKDLGFTYADRIENIRRVGEVAKLMTDAGLIVITAFISPFRSERQMVRDMMAPGEFVEVFVDTPLSVVEERDVKGLYAKARSGQLKNFTGIDSPYETPQSPEIHIDTTNMSIAEAANYIVKRSFDMRTINNFWRTLFIKTRQFRFLLPLKIVEVFIQTALSKIPFQYKYIKKKKDFYSSVSNFWKIR